MNFVFEKAALHTSYASIEADSLEEAIEKLDTDECEWDLQDVSTYSLGYKIEDDEDEEEEYQDVDNELLDICGKGYYCHENRFEEE